MELWLMDNPSNSVDGGSGLGITLSNPAVHARCSFLKGLGEWAPVDKLTPPRAGASPAEHHPRHGARLGPLHEPPALHLPCLRLASLGEKNLQVVNIFLNSNPARSNMKIFCCFSPFLGSIAHLKKISGALETPRAKIGVELGEPPAWLEGVTNSPTVLLKAWRNEKKRNLNTKMGSAALGWDVQSVDGKAHECHQQRAEGWPQQEGFAWLYTSFSFKIKLLPWNTFTDLTIYIYIFSIPCIKEKYTLFQQPRKNCNLLSFKESSYSWKQLSVHVLLTITFYEENKH